MSKDMRSGLSHDVKNHGAPRLSEGELKVRREGGENNSRDNEQNWGS